MPDAQVKASFVFQHKIQKDSEENQLFIPQPFPGTIYKVYFMNTTF